MEQIYVTVTVCIVDDAGMHAARMRSRVYITVRRPSFSPIDSSEAAGGFAADIDR